MSVVVLRGLLLLVGSYSDSDVSVSSELGASFWNFEIKFETSVGLGTITRGDWISVDSREWWVGV